MKNILRKLNINEDLHTIPKPKKPIYDKVRDIVPLVPNYNMGMDLLYLPETKDKYKYLLVCVDLATRQFDMEPLKQKEPDVVLEAFKKMTKRKYIKMPYASITVDSGAEFQAEFKDYMFEKSIFLRVGEPNRHRQNGTTESLNAQIARLLVGYMNGKTRTTRKPYTEWIEALDTIRTDLNKFREIKIPPNKDDMFNNLPDETMYSKPVYSKPPKFRMGEFVNRILEEPVDAYGDKFVIKRFRIGDRRYDMNNREVKNILTFGEGYRYILEGLPHVSFQEWELKRSKEQIRTGEFERIRGKKTVRGVVMYNVKWKHTLVKDSTWEPRQQLIDDGLQQDIDIFEESERLKRNNRARQRRVNAR